MPTMRYRNASAAIEWLCRVFGFEQHAVYPGPEGTIGHAELTLGGGMIMLGSQKDDDYSDRFKTPEELHGFETRGIYIVVPDADAVYARAQAANAEVTRPIHDTPYGSRECSVKDLEGHTWSIGTYDPWTEHD